MLDPTEPAPDVGRNETLSRFILSRSHYRPSDGTAKQNAFVPHPHTALSVNRDLDATDEETWRAGRSVAEQRGKTLYRRADALPMMPPTIAAMMSPSLPRSIHWLPKLYPALEHHGRRLNRGDRLSIRSDSYARRADCFEASDSGENACSSTAMLEKPCCQK